MVESRNISELSQYYLDPVAKYLASGIIITGSLKSEALNEIRNAFTHVARAHTLDLSAGDLEKEYRKAHGHLQRVALDSAKDSIFELRTKSENAISMLEGEFLLGGTVHSDLTKLNHRRRKLSQEEALGPPNRDLVDTYGELLNDYDKFYSDLDKQYSADSISVSLKKKKLRSRITLGISFLAGVLASYLANHLPLLGDEKNFKQEEINEIE